MKIFHSHPNQKANSFTGIAAIFTATVFLCFVLVFSSFADRTSDQPVIPSKTTEAATEASSEDCTSSESSSADSGSSASSSTSDLPVIDNKSSKKKTEISDDPQIEVSTKTAETTAESSSSASTSAPASKETQGSETGKQQEETTAPQSGADIAVTSDSPVPTNQSKKSSEISSAPIASGAEAEATTAETAESTTAETTATTTGPSAEASTGSASGPGSSASSTASSTASPGSVHAGDAATRLELGFTLISPTHKKGSLKVSRAAISLASGSWQELSYKDNIRYPYYMYNDQRTDSSGVLWYIARVYARRFGDTTSDDGAYKTSLWMNASDCSLTSSITVPTTNSTRLAIVKAALSLIGKQYVYAGNGPDAFDCSGLVKYVYRQAGITVPRTSYQLMELDGQISAAELRPGDIMARNGHAGIYIGNDIFVHASDSSVGVVAENLSVYNQSNKFTSFINVIGD